LVFDFGGGGDDDADIGAEAGKRMGIFAGGTHFVILRELWKVSSDINALDSTGNNGPIGPTM